MNQGQLVQQARRDPLQASEVRLWIETPEGVLIQRKLPRADLAGLSPSLAAELDAGEAKAAQTLEERITALQSARAAISARRAQGGNGGGRRGPEGP